ncbi:MULTISPECIES: hypothetical protein [unclassified Streptomyces]|uniref:hypothetical protein n=1 Tax=unclassified Streptomyces TaxID=2593676 RepID=UPI00379E5CF2
MGAGTQADLVAGHQDLEAVGKAAHDLFNDFTTYSGHASVAFEAAAATGVTDDPETITGELVANALNAVTAAPSRSPAPSWPARS